MQDDAGVKYFSMQENYRKRSTFFDQQDPNCRIKQEDL